MSRRFVNLMVERLIGHNPASMLHRVNPWRCFYPTAQEALDAAAAHDSRKIIEDARLPRAAMSFCKPLWPDGYFGDTHFASLGSSGDDIICTDQDGNTLHYDAAARAVRVLPAPHAPKNSPVSLTVGDGLYLLEKEDPAGPVEEEDHPFEALVHRRRPEPACFSDGGCDDEKWYWRSLPPPPYAFDCEGRRFYQGDYSISSYTVAGDSHIWISTARGGTFSFDTTSGMWSMAGEWALPFCGRVHYAPELGLWFGFSSQTLQFAASDLSVTRPPELQKAWDELAPPLPKRWTPVPAGAYLVPLGAGKFCIVRMFDKAEEAGRRYTDYRVVGSFAVFTGVEVERGSGGSLRMIKHKSRRYTFSATPSAAIWPNFCDLL